MPYDDGLAERLREIYAAQVDVIEKKMFGGLAFMVGGHMSCGVVGHELMVRVGPQQYETCLKHPDARKMDFTGKALKGFVYVSEEGLESDEDLSRWVGLSLKFVRSLPAKI